MQLYPGNAFEGIQPSFTSEVGIYGERIISNKLNEDSQNELYIDNKTNVTIDELTSSNTKWLTNYMSS